MHFTQIIFKDNIMDVGPHQNPIDFARINPTNSIILELWKFHSCLLKIEKIKKIKSKKIYENACLERKMATNLLKTRFLITLNPKEGRKREMT